jgi:hypothetical protein
MCVSPFVAQLGGAGGGSSGIAGQAGVTSYARAGQPGTQTGPGITDPNASSGGAGALVGGSAPYFAGAGGGAGYWGGSQSGNVTPYENYPVNASGGGGSGYIISTATSTGNIAGAGRVPGGSTDVDYIAGTGLGGLALNGGTGGNGAVVIYY